MPLVMTKSKCKRGILGQVWYLIVSIPALCTLTYFHYQNKLLYLTEVLLDISDLSFVQITSTVVTLDRVPAEAVLLPTFDSFNLAERERERTVALL